ncbi:hypothetical protein HPB50_013774 [Hyalomma asiaticum]|uniref:Uncharacterized protein n=1 Tax=Hyalomma asiaticum TaxID=266040 RepID=A0ACB7TJX1_HYAAI|nr:hypothetical protein HPB50_013774 [Hyalomma asiaticum]
MLLHVSRRASFSSEEFLEELIPQVPLKRQSVICVNRVCKKRRLQEDGINIGLFTSTDRPPQRLVQKAEEPDSVHSWRPQFQECAEVDTWKEDVSSSCAEATCDLPFVRTASTDDSNFGCFCV